MMPLPFLKVTAKEFKRNLVDDDDDSDSSTYGSSSETSSSSSSITSSSRSRNISAMTSSNGSDNADKSTAASSSEAPTELRDVIYRVPPIMPDGNDSAPHGTTMSTSTPSGSATSGSGSATSGSTMSGMTSTSGSSTTPSMSNAKEPRGRTGAGGVTSSSSEFSLEFSLDPNDVIDPRTGKHIFVRVEREMMSVLPEKVPTPPPTLSLDPSEQRSLFKAYATHAMNAGMHAVHSSLRSSTVAQSTFRGLKKAKKTALLTLRIGEYVVKTQVVGPAVKKAMQEWKSFNRFRERQREERRSKTLDWFENRVQTMKRDEGIKRQQQQDRQRAKLRTRLKQERAREQANDFLNETRAEFEHQADLRLTTSLEKEKVRDYFLKNNDAWQMQTLTRHVHEAEDHKRQQKQDAEAEKVRHGDFLRRAAADECLAEYDRGEVITQATLRIIRRSGIVAGVNAPPVEVEKAPLETDTSLLLRLKPVAPQNLVAVKETETGKGIGKNNSDRSGRHLLPSLGNDAIRQSSSAGGSRLPDLPARGRDEHHQEVPCLETPVKATKALLSRPGSSEQPVDATGSHNSDDEAPGPTDEPAGEGGQPSRDGETRGRAGAHNRGKKRSSQAFEVDLLRFRSVEQIRGWKLGAAGGASLASDLANGACPRLSILHLSWCSLGDRGTRAIVRALSGGGGASAAGRTLRELDLRGNAVTVIGMRVLGGALDFGGFPALRALDLGCNSLRDEGGKAVAHRLLAGSGTWRRLTRLDLSGNGMGDGGVEAVFKAVTARGVTLAPDIEMISVRKNSVSSGARQRMTCPPPFLIM